MVRNQLGAIYDHINTKTLPHAPALALVPGSNTVVSPCLDRYPQHHHLLPTQDLMTPEWNEAVGQIVNTIAWAAIGVSGTIIVATIIICDTIKKLKP